MKRVILFFVAAFSVAMVYAQRTERTDTLTVDGKQMVVTKVSTTTFTDDCKRVIESVYTDGKSLGYTQTNWFAYEGKPMPDFEIISASGKSLKSSDLKGKTIVISFWISTCGPCRKELGRVGDEIISQYPADKFTFLAVGAGADTEAAKKFRESSNATFELYCDPTNSMFPKFADNGFPKTFVVDSKGIVRFTEAGYNNKKFETLKAQIKAVYDQGN